MYYIYMFMSTNVFEIGIWIRTYHHHEHSRKNSIPNAWWKLLRNLYFVGTDFLDHLAFI